MNADGVNYKIVRAVEADDGGVLLSVVIPTHNRANELVRALRALQEQGMRSFEVLVIDNGPSTDNTKELVLEMVARDSRIVYVSTEAKGNSAALNIGCKLCNASIIVAMDDDWLMIDTKSLEYILNSYRRAPDVGVLGISHDYNIIWKSTPGWKRASYRALRILHRAGKISRWGRVATRFYYFEPDKVYDVDHVKGYCFSFRREVAYNAGLFPELYTYRGHAYRSETELCRNIAKQGYRVIYTTEIVGIHLAAPRPGRLQERSENLDAVKTRSMCNTIFIARNYWSRTTAWIFILYDVLVGNYNHPGLLRCLASVKHAFNTKIVAASVKGKVEGYRLYLDKYVMQENQHRKMNVS
jgi:GT2 family glycosyltransferase